MTRSVCSASTRARSVTSGATSCERYSPSCPSAARRTGATSRNSSPTSPPHPPTETRRRWSASSATTSATSRTRRRRRCGSCCSRRAPSPTARWRPCATGPPPCSRYRTRSSTTPGTRH